MLMEEAMVLRLLNQWPSMRLFPRGASSLAMLRQRSYNGLPNRGDSYRRRVTSYREAIGRTTRRMGSRLACLSTRLTSEALDA